MSGSGLERKLVSILIADIVGYSRLMSDDEAGTLSTIKSIQSEVLDPALATHRGRVVVCWLDKMASRGLRFAYEVRRGDGELLATGGTEHVWVDRASGRPCRIPGILKEPFESLRGGKGG